MLNIDKRHLQIILVLSSDLTAKHLLSLEELNWDNKSTCWFKVISKVEWIHKKSADFVLHGSKYGHVFMLKVVHSLAFDTMFFYKSSFIFTMN